MLEVDGFKETDGLVRQEPRPKQRDVWHIVAALSGFISILFATHEAHMFHPKEESLHEVYRRGNQLHLFYSLMIAAAPMARRTRFVAGLCILGILCFSGSCYLMALTGDFKYASLAPYGGISFMAAWLAWAF